jgi:hypothetical protein
MLRGLFFTNKKAGDRPAKAMARRITLQQPA